MTESAHVLIVEDDPTVRNMLSMMVPQLGHRATAVETLAEAFHELRNSDVDIVLLDVMLPDGDGLEALPGILSSSSAPQVLIMTAAGSIEGAELALRGGAWDYLSKPVPPQELTLQIRRAHEHRQACRSSRDPVFLSRARIVGESPSITQCLEVVARAAASNANVLITGETGVGKEAVAATIHENSSRAQNAFVVVDCSSLPDNLVESILFGHEKAAFTGADCRRDGLVKAAAGGTLFLDEVGELNLASQRAFLRVLQERKYRPIGATHETECDFRLIAATNRDLNHMVTAGSFREDLLFRLRTLSINVPPLRDRKSDLRLLAAYFLEVLDQQYRKGIKRASPELMSLLEAYHWPGNVRELRSALEYAYFAAGAVPVLTPYELPAEIRIALKRHDFKSSMPKRLSTVDAAAWVEGLPISEYRFEMEKIYLIRLMERAENDTTEASRMAGLSRSRFYGLLKKHEIAW